MSRRGSRTVKSHDVLQWVQVLHASLVTAEDLCSGTKIIREVLSALLPHFSVTTQGINVWVERDVVGRPVPCHTCVQTRKEFAQMGQEAEDRKGRRSWYLCVEPEFGRRIPPTRGSAPRWSERHHQRCDPAGLYFCPAPCTGCCMFLHEQ